MITKPPQLDYDLNELSDLIFNRAAQDTLPESIAIRTYLSSLGADDTSILYAYELSQLDAGSRPARPILALREGTTRSSQRIVSFVTFRWIIYDEQDQGYRRINRLIPLLSRAYAAAPVQLSGRGVIESVTLTDPSGTSYDPQMQLNFRYVSCLVSLT